MEYTTFSPKETEKFGEKTAKKILKEKSENQAEIISLEGVLGSGKTTFLKGFARGLGIKEMIKSPSFVIMKKYKLTTNNKRQTTKSCKLKVESRKLRYFYHIDCYRIERIEEISNLGWEGIIGNPQNIVAVEWGEKIKKILPSSYLKINFEFVNENIRKIKFLNRTLII